MIGQKLAHYTITAKLGEGGMGVVYEAQDGHLGRAVALKVLPHDVVANPARKQRFVQEAKAASALNHPNIVTIYDIDCEDGVDYMAMELIRGKTLEQLLSRGKLRLQDALKYGAQISDALAAAHAAGIVHRDLKPGNIMITERGDVKVLDFGLAKLTDDNELSADDATRTQHAVTEEGSVVGSAPYMSPEQAEGRKVDARSDIFSFGSVLYEMLTGKRAFRGANRTATMAAILKDDPQPLADLVPEIPREIEREVTRCLRKDLDRRSQSMAQIHIALQELREEAESGSLSAQSPAAVPAKPRLRWPIYAGIGALAAAAGAWIFVGNRPAPQLKASVVTSFVGQHGGPSLSPDGAQFAFTWNGDVPDGIPHVYISLVGKGTPLRLTPQDEVARNPSWSPDGQSIAYYRRDSASTELAVMPALGGPARKIAQGAMTGRAAWSPDAKWLFWCQRDDRSQLFSIRAALSGGGEAHKLLDPPPIGGGYVELAVSPDGRHIVFSRRIADYSFDLSIADLQDGKLSGAPRQLTQAPDTIYSPIWTRDGKEILYIEGGGTSEIFVNRVSASGGQPRRIEGSLGNATWLTLASKADRLLYSTASTNMDIYRFDMSAGPNAKPERFLSSTRHESQPCYSPDGKRIAFTSNRGGVRQIWVAGADGSNPVPFTSFTSGIAGSPQWSPDGETLAFDARPEGNADVYTVPAAGGQVKRLTDNPQEDHVPTWSPDGKWIYFASARAGTSQIFRMRPDGGGVQQITRDGGGYGMVTPDGKWLYFSVSGKGILKMPPDGGEATSVVPNQKLNMFLSFAMKSQGLYVNGRRVDRKFPSVFFPFDGGEPRTIMLNDRAPFLTPDVSPDGRYFLYSLADDPVYEIMMVDNFR